jgi:hypothetical protein
MNESAPVPTAAAAAATTESPAELLKRAEEVVAGRMIDQSDLAELTEKLSAAYRIDRQLFEDPNPLLSIELLVDSARDTMPPATAARVPVASGSGSSPDPTPGAAGRREEDDEKSDVLRQAASKDEARRQAAKIAREGIVRGDRQSTNSDKRKSGKTLTEQCEERRGSVPAKDTAQEGFFKGLTAECLKARPRIVPGAVPVRENLTATAACLLAKKLPASTTFDFTSYLSFA